MTKIGKQYMNYFLSAIILFIVLGVYPALSFENKVVAVVDRVHELGYTKNQEFYQNEFQNIDGLQIQSQQDKLILNFKKPNYLFWFFNDEAEKKYNESLPNNVELKINSK